MGIYFSTCQTTAPALIQFHFAESCDQKSQLPDFSFFGMACKYPKLIVKSPNQLTNRANILLIVLSFSRRVEGVGQNQFDHYQ